MQLQEITLVNFKNYEKETIALSEKLNCLVGNNGMGKTNFLDAIYYLCMGKSYFKHTDSQITRKEADFFRLEGHFLHQGKKEKLVAKVRPRKQKVLERNDVAYQKLSEHIGHFPIVAIVPDDTYLVKEGSEVRRQFLDNTLSQIDSIYLQQLIEYNKLLKQRNAALKQFGQYKSFDEKLLSIYDEQMQEPAQYIFKSREQFIIDFRPIFQKLYAQISKDSETVNCFYKTQLQDADFQDLVKEAREKDRILQRSTAGIHKDDLQLQIKGDPVKKFASQGQLKSIILALKLAQYEVLKIEKSCLPILLLDDIFDKLDTQRVLQLLQLISQDTFGQIFLTDTHESRINQTTKSINTNFQTFIVQNGTILS